MTLSAREFAKQKDKEREKALREVSRAYARWQASKDDYEQSVIRARALGLSNTKIARQLGISETAVRMFLKRREETAV